MKTIKITKVPGVPTEVVVADTAKLADVLAAYKAATGQETKGYTIKCNDFEITDMNTNVLNGAVIYLVQQVKGNLTTVKVTKVPGMPLEVTVEDGATVKSVLDTYTAATGQSIKGYTIKCNDVEITDTNVAVAPGAVIYLVQQVKGNK